MTVTVSPTVGKHVPALSSALRPQALDEMAQWGGLDLIRDKRVLDLGCGDGRLALGAASRAREVVGLDPDREAIRAATQRARDTSARNARFVVGAAQELPFDDTSFDVVILSWTL